MKTITVNLDKIHDGIKEWAESPLPDGPHWTPDGGRFWAKGGKYYWPDGDVTTNQPLRLWDTNVTPESVEDYSAWSDEKRAAVVAESKRKRDDMQKQMEEYEERRQKLIDSARAKLTPEEFAAVFESGADN